MPPPIFVLKLQSIVAAESEDDDDRSNEDTPMDGEGALQQEAMDIGYGKDNSILGAVAAPLPNASKAHWQSSFQATVKSDDKHDGEGEDEMDVHEERANKGE